MPTRLLSGLCLLITAALFASPPAPERAVPSASPQEIATVVTAENAFAVDLYRQIAAEKKGEPVLIAPLSIGTALTMATEGAVEETAAQMLKTLHLPAGNLAGVHRGNAALRRRIVPAEPPAALAARIAALRKDLDASNAMAEALMKTFKYDEAQKTAVVGEKLATEINGLLKQTRPYELRIANALWAEKTYPFRGEYLAALQPNYGAVLFPIDFINKAEAGRVEINRWVEQNTDNRIQNLIPSGALDDLTRLVITNSVFFQGEWREPFDKGSTRPMEFTLADKSTKQTPMMHTYHPQAGYAAFRGDGSAFKTPREIPVAMRDDDPSLYPDSDGYVVLSLPYRGERLAMTVVLPRSADGLAALEKKLTSAMVQTWQTRENRSVQVYLPRFKLEAEYSLNQPLQELGMVRAFRDTIHPDGAQFDKMTSNKAKEHRLYISQVIHKTFLEVNEKGTEAAAASAVIFAAPTAAPPGDFEPPKTRPFTPTFKADRPYLCLIQERESGAIFFMGRVLEPKE